MAPHIERKQGQMACGASLGDAYGLICASEHLVVGAAVNERATRGLEPQGANISDVAVDARTLEVLLTALSG